MIITVDGSSGSGKTSLCNGLANKFSNTYTTYSFSSGVLYRLIAKMLNTNNNLNDVLKHFSTKDITYHKEDKMFYYDDIKLDSDDFQTEEIAKQASILSQNIEVRNIVNNFLHDMYNEYANNSNSILFMDGRDLGSIVFKNDALVKFFLEIDIEQASIRRAKQLYQKEEDIQQKQQEIKHFLKSRNDADKNRSIAPLKKVDDSIVYDTSSKTLQESIDECYEIVLEAIKDKKKMKR